MTGLAACLLGAAQVNLFERFDQIPSKGQLTGGATIAADAGVEKGALTANGNGKNFQYIYQYKFPAKPGEKYTITLNAKTSGKNTGLFVVVLFDSEKGKPAVKPLLFRIAPTRNEWYFKIFDFTVPAGATA